MLALRLASRTSASASIRTLSTTTRLYSDSHSADSYNKDVDANPPSDPKIHRVDSSSEAAHKPHEPAPTTHTSPTETTSKEHPYTPKGSEGGKRYGGTGSYERSDSGAKGSGPESGEAGGRKPERR